MVAEIIPLNELHCDFDDCTNIAVYTLEMYHSVCNSSPFHYERCKTHTISIVRKQLERDIKIDIEWSQKRGSSDNNWGKHLLYCDGLSDDELLRELRSNYNNWEEQ